MTSPATDVLVTSRSFGGHDKDPVAFLAAHGLGVVKGPTDHDLATLGPLLGGAVAWIAGTAPVTGAHLEVAGQLRIVARYGTGVDSVDLAAAWQRGIVVTNTPGANARGVAEHTVALMLACLRHLLDGDRAVRAGEWPALRGRELASLTVGLIGFGMVGRDVARILRGFGSRVLAHDPFVGVDEPTALGVQLAALDSLLAHSDIVSLHRPPGDKPLVGREFLHRLRTGAVLVNTARAALVDEDEVADALRDGALGAFAADVLEAEDGGSSPLTSAPGTVLTPHCAAHTDQAVERMSHEAAADVVRVVVHDEPPLHPVTAGGTR